MPSCPPCLGRGHMTGPGSFIHDHDPNDPFNAEVRVCDECEGSGVVSNVRYAAILAEAEQSVQRALNAVLGEPGDPRALPSHRSPSTGKEAP